MSASGLFILATVRVDSSLALVMAGMILQFTGTGIFTAPNISSILSTVEQSRYGTLSGFMNLVRNSANVTSIALVTAIVTTSMASMGYEPSLSAVSDEAGDGVIVSFTAGLRIAYLAMGSLIVLGVAISWFKSDTPVIVPDRAHQRQSESTTTNSD